MSRISPGGSFSSSLLRAWQEERQQVLNAKRKKAEVRATVRTCVVAASPWNLALRD